MLISGEAKVSELEWKDIWATASYSVKVQSAKMSEFDIQ